MKTFRYLVTILCVGVAFWWIAQTHGDASSQGLVPAPTPPKKEADFSNSFQAAPAAAPEAPRNEALARRKALIDRTLAAVPEGRFRRELLALSEPSRETALDILYRNKPPLEDFGSLHASPKGMLFYACAPLDDTKRQAPEPSQNLRTTARSAASFSAAGGAVPITAPPVRHSKPGAPNVIFLNFSGATISGTLWNSNGNVLVGLPYDQDGDATTFNETEQAVILDVWEMVAEDFSPFDVDVTTEAPATFTNRTAHALITNSVDAGGQQMPMSSAGGVAYLDVFGLSFYAKDYCPAFVYFNNLGTTSAKTIGEAASHEVGHNLGLSHDGQTGGTEYYLGHGSGPTSWAPIMGAGYYQNVTQWTKGDYHLSNNQQDDLDIMAKKLGYGTDANGATPATAGTFHTEGSVVDASGVVRGGVDADLYVFSTGAGRLEFDASSFNGAAGSAIGNLDLKLELLDSAGVVLASGGPPGDLNSSLSFSVPTGTYYLRVTGDSEGRPLDSSPTGYTAYGCAGQYTLTGRIVATAPAIIGESSFSLTYGTVFSYKIRTSAFAETFSATGLPAGLTLDATTGLISGRPLNVGTFTVPVSATNSLGSGNGTLTLTVSDGPPMILSDGPLRQVLEPGGTLSLSLPAQSWSSPITYAWFHNGFPIPGATTDTLTLPSVAYGDAGWYVLKASNGVGTTKSMAMHVLVAPKETEVVEWTRAKAGNDIEIHSVEGFQRPLLGVGGKTLAAVLQADGNVVTWRNLLSSAYNFPADTSDIVQLVTNGTNLLALTSRGKVVVSGESWIGLTKVPEGLDHVVQIAASWSDFFALRDDGTIVAWGLDTEGLLSPPSTQEGFAFIHANYNQAFAITPEGKAVFWGADYGGGLANAIIEDVHELGSTWSLAVGLTSKGGLSCFGGISTNFNDLPSSGMQRVWCYDSSIAALDTNGLLNLYGNPYSVLSRAPKSLNHVFEIAGNGSFLFACRDRSLDTAPVIETQPVSTSVLETGAVRFTVSASTLSGVLCYQWYKDGIPLTGETNASLTQTNATTEMRGTYRVRVSTHAGYVDSEEVSLSVLVIPRVTSRSGTRSVFKRGADLHFEATAEGEGVLTYRWRHNGYLLPGEESPALTVKAATRAQAGYYVLEITDSVGTRYLPFFALYQAEKPKVELWSSLTTTDTATQDSLDGVLKIAAGGGGALFLKADGSLALAGSGLSKTYPEEAGSNVVDVAMNYGRGYSLTADGVLHSWGSSLSEIDVAPVSGVPFVSVSYNVSSGAAVRADGTVAIFGMDDVTLPQNLGRVVSAVAGFSGVLLQCEDGSVVHVGLNYSGRAVLPDELAHPRSMGLGLYYGIAALADGTPISWGDALARKLPENVGKVEEFSVNDSRVLARLENGGVMEWMSGVPSMTPVMSRVVQVSIGSSFGAALYDAAPMILTEPRAATLAPGKALDLEVTCAEPKATYQWYKDGVAISGATQASYHVDSLSVSDAGDYTVLVTFGSLSETSSAAHVTVAEPKPGRLINMSVRSVAGDAAGPLIVGFVTTGGPKSILVRAAGPTLGVFGVPGVLDDPTMAVHRDGPAGDEVALTNDNWGDGGAAATMKTLFGSLGAFGFETDTSADAAALISADGARTVHVCGKVTGGRGVVLVEAYDAGEGDAPRLINVSARNRAGQGAETLIIGFSINGNVAKRVLIRGVGPTLKLFGISNALSDPALSLHGTVEGKDVVLASNDQWWEHPEVATAAAQVGAFALPGDSLDAALLVTVQPGNYTCHVTGQDGSSGEALVELYEVP